MLLFIGDCDGLVFVQHAFISAWVLAWTIGGHILKTTKSISYICECTHGKQDADCEFVMVAAVDRGTSVL